MYVAPDTLEMAALCAVNVDCTSRGTAVALIDADLLSFLGYDNTSTAVIFPPLTVIFTWTGPHRVVDDAPV